MDIHEKKCLQFELWECCNNKCKFCYLGENNKFTPVNLKIKAVEDAYNFISNEEKIAPYNTLSYLGGEFFQGQLETPELKEKFLKLMKKTAELQVSGQIKEFWLLCTLTIGDQKDLYESLDIMNNEYIKASKPELMEQVWIVTSYDTIGRFHTQKMLDTWDYTMKNLYNRYPGIKFNTCMILTQDLITKYLEDKFSFNEYMNTYHSSIFFKQPSPGSTHIDLEGVSPWSKEGRKRAKEIMEKTLPGFFPKRETFLQFLIKFKQDCPSLYDHLFNIIYRADDLYRNMNDEEEGHRMQLNHRNKSNLVEVTEGDNGLNQINEECGHLLNYAAYIDSDACCLCDRDLIGD